MTRATDAASAAWNRPIFAGAAWSLALSAILAPAAARAQDAAAAAPAAEPAALQEIVVTATKRKEELSKVPISIAAYSAEALEASGVKNVSDLAQLTPGVEFDNSAGFGPGTLTNIAIRGINSTIGTSTTGIYVDDTPIQARVTALSYFGNPLPVMFDVDHVEVDRGPQGSLFGAGAEGGALRFISPDPSLTTYSGFARTELSFTEGGDPSYEAGAAVGGPIIPDKLGFRASAWYRNDGGYVDRVDPFDGATVASDSNWTRSYAVRGAVTLVPVDGIKITPSIYDQSVRINDSSAYFEYLSNPGDDEFKNGRLLGQPSTDRFFLPSLKIEADLGPVDFTSVTSLVNRAGRLQDDLTSYNGALLGPYVPYGNPRGPEFPESYADAGPGLLTTSLHQVSEEARLSSNDPAARLQWTVGIYYSSSRQEDEENLHSAFYAVNFFGVPANQTLFLSSLTSSDSQIAGFGQADYKILDDLTLTLGLRIAHTDSTFTQIQSGPIADPAFPWAAGSQQETPITPKFGLSYQVDPDNMVYATVSKGYRVGGANPPIPLATAANPAGCPLATEPGSYQSDSVWSYEVGAKDKLWGGRLKLDTSAFHVEWNNIQQQVFLATCGFGYVANTGTATADGFDLGVQAAVTQALTLGLSLAYTDAHVTKNVSVLGATVEQDGDTIGSPPAVNSPWNITASAEYGFTAFDDRDAYVRVEDIFHSHNPGPYNTMIAGSPIYTPAIPANPATNELNVRAAIDLGDVELAVFINNLLDSHPALNRYQDTSYSSLFTDTTFRPLTGGASVTYRF